MKNGSFSRLAASAAAALLMFSSLSMTGCAGKKSQIKYATDYTIELKKDVELSEGWRVRKGEAALFLWNEKKESEKDEKEQLEFRVHDSEDIAKERYKELYNSSGPVIKEGDNWYVGKEPGVCDASITLIVCREDNVIITGEVLWVGEWGSLNEVRSENATEYKDPYKKELEEYVIKNSGDLKKFVMKDLLGY